MELGIYYITLGVIVGSLVGFSFSTSDKKWKRNTVSTIFLLYRKHHLKLNVFPFAFCGYRTAVKLNNLPCNGKAQTGPAAFGASRGVKSVKLFKNPLQLFCRNGIVMIDKFDMQLIA